MTEPSLELRLPPQSIAAEEGVLAACFIDPQVVPDVRSILDVDDFWRDAHQVIYRVICDFDASGRNVELVGVYEELRRRDQLDRVGDYEGIAEIMGRVVHALDAIYHAQIVKQKSVLRQVIAVSREMAEDAYRNVLSAEQVLASAERRIASIDNLASSGDPITMVEAMAGVLDDLEKKRAGDVVGVQTPFRELNEMTGGLLDTNLIVVAARPGKGKTSLALAFAEYCAYDSGVPCLFISEEMNSKELATRSLSSRSRIPHEKFRKVDLLGYPEMRSIAEAYHSARAGSPFFIADSGGMSVAQVASLARRLVARHGVRIVFVDYLQLLKSDHQGRENRQEVVAGIARDLKCLAMNLKIPVVALSQLNRQLENREDSRPRLSDLRESGAIENDANIVLMLHQPDKGSNIIDCIVEKNRNGPTGDVKLSFFKYLMRFESALPVEEYEDGTPEF